MRRRAGGPRVAPGRLAPGRGLTLGAAGGAAATSVTAAGADGRLDAASAAASTALSSAADAVGASVGGVLQPLAGRLSTSGFNAVDAVLGVVLLASVLVGIARGFVFEILSLAGWVAAWFGAAWLAPQLSPHLPVAEPGTALREGVAFVLGFVLCLLVWSLAARLVRLLLHATPLSLPDRLLGAGFGLLRGGVLLLALATAVAFTPLAKAEPWRESRAAGWLASGLEGLRPLLPPEWARRLPRPAPLPGPV